MRKLDLTGKVFGQLSVVGESPTRKHGKVHWECICKCGASTVIAGGSLQAGLSKTCGCGIKAANIGRSQHGMTNSPEHKAWRQLIGRCESRSNPAYSNYGGRGISVCASWRNSFPSFLADMGLRPTAAHSIDRRDTNGDYTPENCRWATPREQSENTRTSRIWRVEGLEFESSSRAAQHFGVSQPTIFRWCNGYQVNGQQVAPRESCSSFLKYEVSP